MQSRVSRLIFVLVTVLVIIAPAFSARAQGLTWDSEMKEFPVKAGATNLEFSFSFTNHSPVPVVITTIKPSCGCTGVRTPPLPWKIEPGGNGVLAATIDLRGKYGTLMKSISVETKNFGPKHLITKIILPDAPANGAGPISDRMRNQLLTMADRQVVFRGDCARCHVEPGKDKYGAELYSASCAICHDTPLRATMVPDLRALNKPTDEGYWNIWIRFGKVASLMPGFGKEQNGPLTDKQVESLVKWLADGGLKKLPPVTTAPGFTNAPVASPAPASAAPAIPAAAPAPAKSAQK